MARTIYPEDFDEQKILFDLVKGKHYLDGLASVLTALLVQKSIDLTADQTAVNEAEVHNENQIQFYLDAEENRKQRDLRVDVIFQGMRGAVQFLKSYYKPDVEALGTWGIIVDGGDRIVYPQSFLKQVKLMFKIKAKHDSFPGTTSPLNPYLTEHSIDLNIAAIALNNSKTYNANFKKNRRDGEKEGQFRDNLMKPVMEHLHIIGNYLMKLYKGSEQKLGDWGFTVDRSPREPKLRNSTIGLDNQIIIKGVALNSTFTNTGTVALHVYKGLKREGTFVVVQPGATLGMKKGYSSIVVFNPSNSMIGKCSTLIHH